MHVPTNAYRHRHPMGHSWENDTCKIATLDRPDFKSLKRPNGIPLGLDSRPGEVFGMTFSSRNSLFALNN